MAELSENPARPVPRKKAAAVSPRLQSYANQSLAELTEKLVKSSKEEKGHSLSSKTRDIVYALKAYKLRHSSNAHAFLDGRGVEALLSLLALCAEQEGRDRGLLLATLANLCALHSDCRTKVMGHGLTQVGELNFLALCRVLSAAVLSTASVLSHTQTPATLCTLARLIANLSLDPCNIPRLQGVGVVRELSHALFFQTASDSASKLSVLRALRLLGTSASCREELKASEGLPGLMDCLRSGEQQLVESALHTLHSLLLDSDPDVIQALVANKGLPPVVKLCNHGDREVGGRAVEVLVGCAGVSEGRVGLHSAGGVECLLSQLEQLESDESLFPSVVSALCASCRDVGGRQRMRDCGGLERLIQLLSSSEQAPLHPDILSALVCYYFDEHSLKFMVKKLGLLRALTYHLQQMSCRSPEPAEEVGSGSATGSPDNGMSGSGDSSASGPGPSSSPTYSGFETTTSQDSSSPFPLPPPSPREDDRSTPSNSPSCGNPSLLTHSPSPSSLSTSSPSPSPSPTDSQPPSKRQRLSSDLEFAHPTPVNFLDSLLSSPSPYQTPPRRPDLPTTPDSAASLESHVVQLLSRVSHLRDCLPLLASRELLQAILDCLLSSPSFLDTHIFKTLSRVFASPHCFQEVVCCLIPSRLHHHICLTPAPSPSVTSNQFDLPSPFLSLPSPHCPSPSSPGPGLAHMCRQLLGRLSRVGQSPYGQGVLAHLLLTGEERDRTASALTCPLLCRAVRVCRRLMVDYRGLEILVQLVTSSSSLRESAADSLLALASSTADLRLSHDMSNSSPRGSSPALAACSGIGCRPRCRYRDYDHTPFDYMVKLDRCGTGTEQIHLPAHRAVLMEASEVFDVMLGGHFLESGQSEVYLRDVHPQAFLSLLHHIYGCGWQCWEVVESLGTEDVLRYHTDLSSSIIAAITSNFDLPDRPVELLHTLCCLQTASRFLLGPMRESCERQTALFLSTSTVVPLFLFSRLHSSVWLAEECVRFLLSLPPSPHSRACLLELVSCPEAPTALDLLQTIVSCRLHTTP